MGLLKNLSAVISWYSGLGYVFRVFAEPKGLFIAYHAVGETDPSFRHINVCLGNFKKHIGYLRLRGYEFHCFRDAGAYSANKRAYLYFDDGLRSVRECVYPFLKKEKIPATLFITTEYIDQGRVNMHLNWEDVKNMLDVFEIGSHGVHHLKLNKIPIEEAVLEMKKSKEIIEQKLAVPVVSFSYPKGRSNQELEQKARIIGYTITTADSRFRKIRPDPYDSVARFQWKMLGI